MESFPPYLQGTEWDVILVDSPMGGGGTNPGPGRMKPIFWTSQLLAPNGHAFVHDAERDIERRFSERHLGDGLGRRKVMETTSTLKGGWRQLAYFPPHDAIEAERPYTRPRVQAGCVCGAVRCMCGI